MKEITTKYFFFPEYRISFSFHFSSSNNFITIFSMYLFISVIFFLIPKYTFCSWRQTAGRLISEILKTISARPEKAEAGGPLSFRMGRATEWGPVSKEKSCVSLSSLCSLISSIYFVDCDHWYFGPGDGILHKMLM